MAFPRQIYMARIYFKEENGYKYRPVLVLREDKNGYIIVPITSQPPENPPTKYHDIAKEPILKWDKYGLDEESYAMCANAKPYDALIFRYKQPIGIMDVDEFTKIVEKVYSYL